MRILFISANAEKINLLTPIFYMVREIENWSEDTVKAKMAECPQWTA